MPGTVCTFHRTSAEAVVTAYAKLVERGMVLEESWREPEHLGTCLAKSVPTREELAGMRLSGFLLTGDADGAETVLPRVASLGDDFRVAWRSNFALHPNIDVVLNHGVWEMAFSEPRPQPHADESAPTYPRDYAAFLSLLIERFGLPLRLERDDAGIFRRVHHDGTKHLLTEQWGLFPLPAAKLDEIMRIVAGYEELLGNPRKRRCHLVAHVRRTNTRVELLYDTLRALLTHPYQQDYHFALTGLEHLKDLHARCVRSSEFFMVRLCSLKGPPGYYGLWFDFEIKKAGIVPTLILRGTDGHRPPAKETNQIAREVAEVTGLGWGRAKPG